MDREKVWDKYFAKLHRLLTSERDRIEHLIREESGKEISKRWEDISGDGVSAYADVAISFIDERLYAYSLDYLDRFLHATSRGTSLRELASLDLSLSWYDWRGEKEEIDKKIDAGLNIMQSPEDIVEDLLDEFGAFPNKTIIEKYSRRPKKNYVPDYALAVAVQKVIRDR